MIASRSLAASPSGEEFVIAIGDSAAPRIANLVFLSSRTILWPSPRSTSRSWHPLSSDVRAPPSHAPRAPPQIAGRFDADFPLSSSGMRTAPLRQRFRSPIRQFHPASVGSKPRRSHHFDRIFSAQRLAAERFIDRNTPKKTPLTPCLGPSFPYPFPSPLLAVFFPVLAYDRLVHAHPKSVTLTGVPADHLEANPLFNGSDRVPARTFAAPNGRYCLAHLLCRADPPASV